MGLSNLSDPSGWSKKASGGGGELIMRDELTVVKGQGDLTDSAHHIRRSFQTTSFA